MNWHLLPLSEIAKLLNSSLSGLNKTEASERLIEFGKNQIEEKKKKTLLKMLLHQFTDFMILILFVAAIISGVLGDITDTIVIFIIIIVNALIGFIQEFRAEKAMEALKKMASSTARTLRDNIIIDLATSDLVPGDVVMLEAGNIIPADIRFIETHDIKIDESALTGESNNVDKYPETMDNGDYNLGDRINMGFKGTFVNNGRAVAYVVATGMNTELGHIAKLIQTEESDTPLQKRLSAFTKKLSVIILLICSLIFGIGLLRGEEILTMILTSISLAVAAIPEALPALVTIALAFGAKRLIENNALIRKLSAVETLGSVTYICTDKTGTLTMNKMTVLETFETNALHTLLNIPLQLSFTDFMALNNDISVDKDGNYLGDSTEVALVQYAGNHHSLRTVLEKSYPRIAELPFDSNRKCMTTLHKTSNGILSVTKGAVETLLDKLADNQKSSFSEYELKANEMAAKGYRVIGYAVRMLNDLPSILTAAEIENSLTFTGLAGIVDPPRPEARKAVDECKNAGIIPVMITGDHKSTATAIAKQLGIINNSENLVLSGSELAKLSDENFKDIVEKVRVYARVNPEQKLRIISALQDKHHFVAMTGDGVNDAPALKNADIGIAMGINGTEVTKEASHMILMDDNFATIVVAVRHGRRIYDNILKFIRYIMTGNAGEIWSIFLAPFFGLPIPLLAIHILWINLVTDGLPGLALASEPSEANIMKRPPVNPRQSLFTRGIGFHILWVGLLMSAVTISMQAWALRQGFSNWQTITFTVLCFSQMGHVMAIRSDYKSIFQTGIFANKPMIFALFITIGLQLMIIYIPFFNAVFKTQPLSLYQLTITIAISSIVFWAVETEKWIKRLKNRT